MNSLRKMMFVGLMMVVALVAAACGGGDGGGSPDAVVKTVYEAMLNGNVDDAKKHVCAANADGLVASFDMPEGVNMDVSDLKYETTTEEGDNATVTITGVIKVTGEVEGVDMNQDLDVATLGGNTVLVIREDGDWKVCDPTLGG